MLIHLFKAAVLALAVVAGWVVARDPARDAGDEEKGAIRWG